MVKIMSGNYVDYAVKQLCALTAIDSPTGMGYRGADYVEAELIRLGYAPTRTNKGGLVCELSEGIGDGASDGLLLTAHTDTLGGMVKEIKSNGRLRLTQLGGLQPQNIEAENCRILCRDGKVYTGTFQLDNPSVHVNKEYATSERTFDTMEVVIDEVTSTKEETERLGIEVGDIVCFDPRTVITASGYIKSRFLDDKLSVAILLAYARLLKKEKRVLRRRVCIHITVYEEVGHGGASIPSGMTEVLGVDMGCVGGALSCDERKVSICAKDSAGPSDYRMTSRLIALAKSNNLAYAVDVYPFYGSDADAALSAGHDLRHGLIGAGVYASHGYERSHKEGVENTISLIDAYISDYGVTQVL